MKKPNAVKRALFIVLVLAMLAIGGVLTGVFGWLRTSRGDLCVQCGARRYVASFAIKLFGSSVPLTSSSETNDAALTSLWEKYCGGCYHDWISDYVNTRGPLVGARGHWYASSDYPTGQNSEILSNAIESLEVRDERAIALRTIGNRHNLLRFVPAAALHELGELAQEQRRLESDNWWAANSNLFVIETNSIAAEQFLRFLEARTDVWISHAVDRSREVIRQAEIRQQREQSEPKP